MSDMKVSGRSSAHAAHAAKAAHAGGKPASAANPATAGNPGATTNPLTGSATPGFPGTSSFSPAGQPGSTQPSQPSSEQPVPPGTGCQTPDAGKPSILQEILQAAQAVLPTVASLAAKAMTSGAA